MCMRAYTQVDWERRRRRRRTLSTGDIIKSSECLQSVKIAGEPRVF